MGPVPEGDIMNLLLAFAPFLAFALVCHLVGAIPALAAGAIVSLALNVRDALTPGRSPKLLEIATFVLFALLLCYALVAQPDWSLIEVRLMVDCGLLVIVLGSLLVGRPFTIQYARERVPSEQWGSPEFMRINQRITGVWAGAFAVLVIADIAMLGAPQAHRFGVFLTIAALVVAVKLTDRLSGQDD